MTGATTEPRATWAYRINDRGHRLGGYNAVIRVREALNGRWAWREKFRCDHVHASRAEAVTCAQGGTT